MEETSLAARLYRSQKLIRRAEEEIARIYPTDKIKSPVHLSIGQEAAAAGVCEALQPEDIVSITYRGHAGYIAKGAPLKKMFAELFGKSLGCAAGKGGSMHLVSMQDGVLGASAVVGTTIPVAAGVALALKQRQEKRVVVCFLGDGATEEGVFCETINFAVLKRLPILFVCENNGFAIHSPLSKRWSTPDLLSRVKTFGLSCHDVPDGNPFVVYQEAAKAVMDIRRGGVPGFLNVAVYRWKQHVGPGEDFHVGYRDQAEYKRWVKRDPVELVGKTLSEKTRNVIDNEVEEKIAAAIKFAEDAPWPNQLETFSQVYA